jgi:hypothetical protein
LARWGLSIAVPAAAGLFGVIIGAWLAGRRDRQQRRHDFVTQQLRHFYSPLLGLRSEIRMRSEFRLKVHDIANSAWQTLCGDARKVGPEALAGLSKERFPEFDKIIKYDNRQLVDRLLPAYRKMVEIFRENLWLAEPETKAHFAKLLEFIDIWDRSVEDSLPREVLVLLGHDEKSLEPLYKNLQETHDSLRSRLAKGQA